ncbi:NADH:flavin oxidoreductase [Desulfovibrio sp. OttesenSCG-928-O18]|nr:NADH:flavin oxidoreductase [Desulfovibrio sp. OttesenSCG-928-O18]
MKSLFDSVTVGGVTLKNRIIRSATLERPQDESGSFLPGLEPIYENLARGGVGAIITGMMGVNGNSRLYPSMIDTFGRHFVPELRALAERVHAHGCKIVVQLSHCGIKVPYGENGEAPVAPSETDLGDGKKARAITREEIAALATGFADAAARCREAGADAVQLHAAHGYLLSQFLSPYYNKRTDEYGGDIAGRSHALSEVYDAVRAKVGNDYPVWMKINSTDRVDESSTWEEVLWVCTDLAKRGMDAIELSGGISVDAKSSSAQPVKAESDEGIYAQKAIELAAAAPVSVISVCGYRTPAVINEWLNKGDIAGISLCRPLIREPGLVARWQGGDTSKPTCISCNKCFRPKHGFGCQIA